MPLSGILEECTAEFSHMRRIHNVEAWGVGFGRRVREFMEMANGMQGV